MSSGHADSGKGPCLPSLFRKPSFFALAAQPPSCHDVAPRS